VLNKDTLIILLILTISFSLAPFTGHPFDTYVWFKTGELMYKGENIYYPNNHLGYLPLWAYWSLLSYHIYKFTSYEMWLIFIKAPLILSNLFLSLIFRRSKIYLLLLTSPLLIYVSSIWGQLNSLSTLLTVIALILLINKRHKLSLLTLGFSIALKLYSIILLPIFLIHSKKSLIYLSLLPSLILTFGTFLIYNWDLYPLYLTLYYQVFSLSCEGCVDPSPLMNLWFLLNFKGEILQIFWVFPLIFHYLFKRSSPLLDSLISFLIFISLYPRVTEQSVVEPFTLALILFSISGKRHYLVLALFLQSISLTFSLLNFGLLNFFPLISYWFPLISYEALDSLYRENQVILYYLKGILGLLLSLVAFLWIFKLKGIFNALKFLD